MGNLPEYLMYLLVVITGLFVLLVIYVRIQESRGIYQPISYSSDRLENILENRPRLEAVEFPAADGVRLRGLWKSGALNAPAVILFPGNAGNITNRLWWLELVVPEGWSALLFDYRGYGRSAGKPGEAGLYSDVEGAVEFVARRAEGKLFYHGRSLGTVMAARAAAVRPPAGVIFDSGFPDAAAMARTILPLFGIEKLLNVEFDTLTHMEQAEAGGRPIPKLVIHGRADRVVPFAVGRKLYAGLNSPKQSCFIEGAGHNNLVQWAGELEYSRRLRKFLTALE